MAPLEFFLFLIFFFFVLLQFFSTEKGVEIVTFLFSFQDLRNKNLLFSFSL